MGLSRIKHVARSKTKSKPTAATRELMAQEQAMLDKWASVPKFGGKYKLNKKRLTEKQRQQIDEVVTESITRRSTRYLDMVGVGAQKPAQKYTGDKMLGIGQMHKSNAVPVFREEDAEDIAKMRR